MRQLLRGLPLLLLLAFASAGDSASAALRVVCGSSVVYDLTRQIGAGRIAVSSLIPPGADPHTYQPRPDDAKALAGADLVVINGLGFEGWWEKLATEASFPAAKVVVAAARVKPLPMGDAPGHEGHGHAPNEPDPHAFGDVANAVRYAEAIRDGLIRADPAGEGHYRAMAELLIAELRALDAWTKRTLATIPARRRVVITNHDAMQYFARAYGFTVKAPNTALEDSQPSAKQIADLVAFIRAEGVAGVFIEAAKNRKVVEQIAAEAGVRVGGALHLDGIPPADHTHTGYRGMVVSNVLALVEGLR